VLPVLAAEHVRHRRDDRVWPTERYAFTLHDARIRRSGEIPPALDPDHLFAGGFDERRVLDAIATEFGVSLPRFAMTHGRLHTFTTRSWTRPPGPGETYTVITVGR
jgi:hypothetical protein